MLPPLQRRARAPQSRTMWRGVGKARAPFVRQLFQGERAISAVLTFLREAKVERVATLAPQRRRGATRRRRRFWR